MARRCTAAAYAAGRAAISAAHRSVDVSAYASTPCAVPVAKQPRAARRPRATAGPARCRASLGATSNGSSRGSSTRPAATGFVGDVDGDARDLGVRVRARSSPNRPAVTWPKRSRRAVEPHRLARPEQVHAADERVVRRLDQDVVVRPHQAVRVDLPAVPLDDAAVQVVLRQVVGVVLEEHEPAGAAGVHVVEAERRTVRGVGGPCADGRSRAACPLRARTVATPLQIPCTHRAIRAPSVRTSGSDPITRSGVRPRYSRLGLPDGLTSRGFDYPPRPCPTRPHRPRNPRISRPPSRS